MSEGSRVFALAQTMLWVCNAIGGFATPDEINAIIDDFEPREERREPSMTEGFMRLQFALKPPPRAVSDAPSLSRKELREGIDRSLSDRSLSPAWERAREAVTKAVQKHSLKFTGRREDEDDFKEVDPLYCRYIVFRDDDAPYAEAAVDPNLKRHSRPARWHMVRFDASAVIALWPHPDAAAKRKGGAPDKFDWAAVEKALEEECFLQESVPVPNHSDKRWRTQADAMRYLRSRFEREWRDGGPGDTALKRRVGPMLQRIGARMKKVGN
jgi:hypothetical protein